jgi:hypothetical protein
MGISSGAKKAHYTPVVQDDACDSAAEAITTESIIQRIHNVLSDNTVALNQLEERIKPTLEPEQGECGKSEGAPIGLSDLNYALLEIKEQLQAHTYRLEGLTRRVQL